ncbi:DUF5372 family protein [Streptomyces sp. NPDC005356]|uniref:DUF5372 family protein n=1 Tax=Streptomyces sp. NPDC005356 TaxID=3157167 RepID=UPI0033A1858E
MRLIHPFHPRCGEVFEFLERFNSWRGDVVLVLDDQGRRCSFPLEWTDMAPVDVFVAAAGEGCPFRTGDRLCPRLCRPYRQGQHRCVSAVSGC